MVLEKVKAILAEQFDVEEDKITADTDLQEDLGADSLDVVDLLIPDRIHDGVLVVLNTCHVAGEFRKG